MALQRQFLAPLLPTPDSGRRAAGAADFRILEVGCGALTIGAWLIDTLGPFSYACVDVAPWAAKAVIDAGLRIDLYEPLVEHQTTELSINFVAFDVFPHADLRAKRPHIEGNAECRVRPSDRGQFGVVFSFTMMGYLSCPMLSACLDSMAEALHPAGRILVSIPGRSTGPLQAAESSAAIHASRVHRKFVLNYPHADTCGAHMDHTRQWARSNRFGVTVLGVYQNGTSPQETWELKHL